MDEFEHVCSFLSCASEGHVKLVSSVHLAVKQKKERFTSFRTITHHLLPAGQTFGLLKADSSSALKLRPHMDFDFD